MKRSSDSDNVGPLKRHASSVNQHAPRFVSVRDVVRSLGQSSVPIDKPKEIACMTRTKELVWLPGDKSGYETYVSPREHIPLDLNQGFEEFAARYKVPKPDSLGEVLKAINKADIAWTNKPNVVSWRGILTKIMCTPFLTRDSFEVAIWKHRGTLYMSNRETEEKKKSDASMSQKSLRFMYYGYKLEEVCTRPAGKFDVARPVDPRECFCRIFKTKIGSMTVVGAGEMDCFDPRRNVDVELKVTRLLENDRQINSFERYKLLKWYCQSFLAGVPHITVGFRDDDGFVRKLQTFETLQIPRMVRGRESRLWDAKVALQFLERTLDWLDRTIPDCDSDDMNSEGIYLFEYKGMGEISLRQVPRTCDEMIDQELYLS